ncbi:MAG: M48 family metalloprotease [Planctomycetes bacterium]|nr:M48 family metalloprotease [Planctomycetota bacterium]
MTWLLEVGLSNLVVAAVLAMVAAMAGRCFRRPALTHALWLLVFLKLITPPLVPLPLGWMTPEPFTEAAQHLEPDRTLTRLKPTESENPSDLVNTPDQALEPIPAPTAVGRAPSDAAQDGQDLAVPLLVPPDVNEHPLRAEPVSESAKGLVAPWLAMAGGVWLCGSLVWFVLAAHRLERFRRLLRHVHHGQTALQEQTQALAEKFGVPCPAVWVVPGQVSPMLWVQRGKPRLLLPEDLVQRLDPEQRRCLIAHELAHWRRSDHWVRRLELVVLGLYWWCPLVWWARAELEQSEEECCDAWVVWAVPGADRAYALALVETVDFLSGARAVMPPIASGMGQVRQLRRRLTMILTDKAPRALGMSGALTVIALGALLLPLMPSWAQEPVARVPVVAQEPVVARQAGLPQEAVLARQDDGRDAQSQDIQRKRQEIERAHADLRQMQAQLEVMKQELQVKAQRLEELVRRMGEAERAKSRDEGTDRPGEKRKGEPKFTDPLAKDGAGVGRFGSKPEGSGGGRFGGGGVGGPGGDVNRRLDALERKLDDVLRELHNMRQPPRSKTPGSAPGPNSDYPAAPPASVNTIPPVPHIVPTPPVPTQNAPGAIPRAANPPPVDFVPVNPIPRTTPLPSVPPQPNPDTAPTGPRQS